MDTFNIHPGVIAIVVVVLGIILALVLRRNRRDKKDMENTFKNDYRKTPDRESDLDDADK